MCAGVEVKVRDSCTHSLSCQVTQVWCCYHRLIFSLFIPPQDRQKERERERAREMMMGGVIPFLQLCSHKYNWKEREGKKRERESRMVFDAIWLAVLLQSKRQIQLCCFFGVPRVSSHIAESPMRSTTRVCGVCMCVYIHTSGGGVCVCVGEGAWAFTHWLRLTL